MAEEDKSKEEYLVHCHCGKLRGIFKCNNEKIIAWDCNCSDCYMRRNVHFIIPEDDFRLDMRIDTSSSEQEENEDEAQRQEKLLEKETILYTWGTHTAKRQFCRTCGILPWYRPRSNPDGYGISLYCVDWEADTTNKDDGMNDNSKKRKTPTKSKPLVEIKTYDGQNWEDSHSATGIAQLSRKK